MVWATFFFTEAFPASLSELRLQKKTFIPIGSVKEQVFAETKSSLFQMSWHFTSQLECTILEFLG